MKISLIAAMSTNRVIGNKGALPCHLPADLKHFKKLTVGKPVIMGRATYESIGKPLPERTNIVLTRDPNFQAVGCQIVHSLKEAFSECNSSGEVMIIGGGQLFEETLPLASMLYLTIIHHHFEGDAYFPVWDESDWEMSNREDFAPDEKNPYSYSFLTLKKTSTVVAPGLQSRQSRSTFAQKKTK